MTTFRKYRLAVPLVTAKGVVQEVSLRRFRADDLPVIEQKIQGKASNLEKASVLIEVLTDLPEGCAQRLDMADFTDLSEGVADAMEAFSLPLPPRRRKFRLWRS